MKADDRFANPYGCYGRNLLFNLLTEIAKRMLGMEISGCGKLDNFIGIKNIPSDFLKPMGNFRAGYIHAG